MNKIIFIFGNGNLPRLILKKIKNANLDFKILSISEKNSFKSFDSKSVKLGRIITELNGLKKKAIQKYLWQVQLIDLDCQILILTLIV